MASNDLAVMVSAAELSVNRVIRECPWMRETVQIPKYAMILTGEGAKLTMDLDNAPSLEAVKMLIEAANEEFGIKAIVLLMTSSWTELRQGHPAFERASTGKFNQGELEALGVVFREGLVAYGEDRDGGEIMFSWEVHREGTGPFLVPSTPFKNGAKPLATEAANSLRPLLPTRSSN